MLKTVSSHKSKVLSAIILAATLILSLVILMISLNTTTFAQADRNHGIVDEAPIENQDLQEAVDSYSNSVEPNTIDNVPNQNEVKDASPSDGINDDSNIAKPVDSKENGLAGTDVNKNTLPTNAKMIVFVGIFIIILLGAAAYLYRSKHNNQIKHNQKK